MKLDVKEDVVVTLLALRRELEDSKRRMDRVNEIVSEQIQASFKDKSSPEGGRWPNPSDTSVELGSAGNLKKSGKLFKDFRKGKRKQRGVEFRSSLPYASAQHFGNPKNKMFGKYDAPLPARPYLPIDTSGRVYESTQERITESLDEMLQEAIDRVKAK